MRPKRTKPFAANNATVKSLEADGWTCCTVEQTIPHCFIKRDAYNFADILACSPTRGIMLVQATGGGNGPARISKIKNEPRHAIWLASGGRIQVWDWCKVKGATGREARVTEILSENQSASQQATCAWKEDGRHGYWEGACGLMWEFTDGTPETNDLRHCPRCGGRVTPRKTGV